MTKITVQCRLVASEATRYQLWKLMTELNTPLINELLIQVAQHPEFETWRQKGTITLKTVREMCEPLKTDPRFIGQPGRFYTSAIDTVDDIYSSWFKIIKHLQNKLEGKQKWLSILKSDTELVEVSGVTLEKLRKKAATILAKQIDKINTSYSDTCHEVKDNTPPQKTSKTAVYNDNKTLFNNLFEEYKKTKSIINICAISYLLKNNCQVTDLDENIEKLTLRRRGVEIEIQRLTEQVNARIPKGRDLTYTKLLETIAIAVQNIPQDELEAKFWQNNLLRKCCALPFPVIYYTNEDMTWLKNKQGRICVKFNGLGEYTFKVYCGNRQLHWFKRFLDDQNIKKESKKQHSSSLFTLRSGQIVWHLGEGKDEPWKVHRLRLHCCVDTRLWTDEGTQQVRNEKEKQIVQEITNEQAKDNLDKNHQDNIQRKSSTLAKIKNAFPRPTKPIYEGHSNILVGVSLGLNKPATVAVVDATTKKVLTYYSIKQLLGKKYKLLNRRRYQQQILSHERKIAQTLSASNQFEESKLGEYIDRLLANKIVAIAQAYCAGNIVLPKLDDMREQVQSEIQAKAEQKSDLIIVQKKYAKEYRVNIHQWSYGRLIANIQTKAAKAGIVVEEAQQLIRGSPQEKAKELAITAYDFRQKR